jgi:hypothetical protein
MHGLIDRHGVSVTGLIGPICAGKRSVRTQCEMTHGIILVTIDEVNEAFFLSLSEMCDVHTAYR